MPRSPRRRIEEAAGFRRLISPLLVKCPSLRFKRRVSRSTWFRPCRERPASAGRGSRGRFGPAGRQPARSEDSSSTIPLCRRVVHNQRSILCAVLAGRASTFRISRFENVEPRQLLAADLTTGLFTGFTSEVAAVGPQNGPTRGTRSDRASPTLSTTTGSTGSAKRSGRHRYRRRVRPHGP